MLPPVRCFSCNSIIKYDFHDFRTSGKDAQLRSRTPPRERACCARMLTATEPPSLLVAKSNATSHNELVSMQLLGRDTLRYVATD